MIMAKNNIFHKIAMSVIFITIAGLVSYLFYLNSSYRGSSESIYLNVNIENDPIESYEIIETSEGRFVVNNEAKFSFMIPEGWNIEMIEDDKEVELSSPDMIGERGLFPSRGCVIRVGISHFIQDFPDQERRPQDIGKQIAGDLPLIGDAQEVVVVDNRSSLKTSRYRDHEFGRLVLIELPVENTIYHFGIIYSLTDENECAERFDEIIDSVSID